MILRISSPRLKCVLTDEIAGFFDHQYLWKEAINTLDFLNRDSNQGKITLSRPDMPGLTKGEFGWSGVGLATLEVIQNGRLNEF